jgi:2-(1,2-epoxy-1,2-dihydrophenyl)acetyl-CoA isomerase
MPTAEDAPMSLGFVHRGLAPDCGITHFLPRLVGTARAKELLLTGRRFDGAEAQAMGLVSEALPGERLLERASELARELAKGPTIALGLAKTLVDQSWDRDLDQFADIESLTQAVSRTSRDHREGIGAFIEKRSPHFVGE